jgi:hypothetical protein
MTNSQDLNYQINTGGISFERLDGEVVIISFETGKYLNSNNAAADILFLIEHGVARESWSRILSSHFAGFDDTNSGIDEFLTLAYEEKLLLLGDEVEAKLVELPSDYVRKGWETPTLLVFDDLADLLLIDPIHDTSTSGWPTQKNE